MLKPYLWTNWRVKSVVRKWVLLPLTGDKPSIWEIFFSVSFSMTFCSNLISATCANFSASAKQRIIIKLFFTQLHRQQTNDRFLCSLSPITALILSVSASFSTTFCVCWEINSLVFSLSLEWLKHTLPLKGLFTRFSESSGLSGHVQSRPD